ncbi:DUF1217 domain-containing protein [Roseovarius sp. SCSIO 43702]|uniref:DUF1217 domain-containing protein n=1 Tax=Roseovarius sp. SCSIO 43702 TaxID=2823043 RepID=UPI001C73D92F|nr:DUF1217 domain-containing protein [Roseovarius sp. SCSIO 43702]QYX57102.1 DUF1217 domain-containing protein [Roseovarius sp. SCSIO 43702]
MSFQPILPVGGVAGWRLLKATLPAQRQSFDRTPRLERDTAYFEANIASVRNADDLVSDRRLLRVALGAFGLGEDISSTAFVRKILEEGATARDALANRLTDTRYRALAREFGFGDPLGARTGDPGFGERISDLFRTREFEVAVGEQDDAMRLALNAERSLPDLVATGSDETKWLRIMGDPPLRQFFETALGIPDGFAQVDLDRQVDEFSNRARRQLGIEGLSDLEDPANIQRLIDRFLVREQTSAFSASSAGSTALTLLQSMRPLFA